MQAAAKPHGATTCRELARTATSSFPMKTVTRTSVELLFATVSNGGTTVVHTGVYTTGPATPGADGLYATTATVTHTQKDKYWFSEDEFVFAGTITGLVCFLVAGLLFVACATMWWLRQREQRRAKRDAL